MKVIVDCVGVRDGGAANLLELLLEQFCACRPKWEWLFCIQPHGERDFGPLTVPDNAEILEVTTASGWFGRYCWLNRQLPKLAVRRRTNILFSFANLPPKCPRVPTVLFIQQMKAIAPSRYVSWRESIRLNLLKLYLQATAGAANRIVVQSEQMKDLLINMKPRLREITDVIQSPVQVNRMGDNGFTALRRAIQGSTQPRLAYVSLARSHKNHLNLIRALALVRKEIPGTTLFLTVPAPSTELTDSLVACIHSEAHALDVTDAIVWLGLLKPAEVATVYDSVDAMVFPSLLESFGMPLAEAVCAHLPVIASDLPFAREILGNAGAYFDPHDPRDMASVISSTLLADERLTAMRSAAEERTGLFTPQHVAERFCLLFESVAQGAQAT